MQVIDGSHRVVAARLRGHDAIEAQFLDCEDEEAFVLAVEANVAHGLPLSLADRTSAAKRIVATHPDWSDRGVASVTGLAHKTVGSIRRRLSGEVPQPNTRRGRDGRVRPVDAAKGRREASRLLVDRPDASLREIARAAGVCPATVRDVRDRLRRGEDPMSPRRRDGEPSEVSIPSARKPLTSAQLRAVPASTPRTPREIDPSELMRQLRKDPSLRFPASGRVLLRLLDVATTGPREWELLRNTVPAHCTPLIAAAARECAQAWHEFATDLEQRSMQQSSG
jgi:ParB-like chromosome segregation protein Spo0J